MFGKKKLIQEWEQKEADWKKQLQEADNLANEQSELAAKELRVPLVKLQRSLQEALKNNSSSQETIEQTLSEITEYKKVIDDIFSITRANLYKEAGLFVPIDISEAIDQVASQFTSIAKEKNLIFSIDIEAGLTYPAHPTYFRKMISLLIDNALKCTKKGTISLSLKRVKNNMFFILEDTGIGMKSEEVSKAFKRFYRTEKSRQENISGHGIGLNLAQWIARLHTTDLEVTSMTDKGTTFVIRFPLTS